MNYILNAPIEGCPDINLYSKSGLELSKGYKRIVIGGRGPYVEFTEDQLEFKSFHIPKDQLYRLTDKRVYYVEMRSIDDAFVKLYYQLQTVAYADYKIGMLYSSPYDLYLPNGECMATSTVVVNKDNEFFT
jgi:hypothetical protein